MSNQTNQPPVVQEEKLLPVLQRPEAIAKLTMAIMPLYKDEKVASTRVMSEIMEFNRTLQQIKPEDLAQVPQQEVFRVGVSSFATGLSWAAEERNFYLTTRNVKVGQNWEKRLELTISHNGELSLRRSQGIIKMVDGPHCVYEGDRITGLNPAKNTLDHEKAFPSNPKSKVIAVYCFVVLPSGEKLLRFFDQSNFDRWAGFSRKQNTPKDTSRIESNRDYANELYRSYNGGIDPGFASAKCVKHAWAGLPKCKTFGLPIQPDPDEPIEQVVYDQEDNGGYAQEVDANTPVTENSPEAKVLRPDNDEDF